MTSQRRPDEVPLRVRRALLPHLVAERRRHGWPRHLLLLALPLLLVQLLALGPDLLQLLLLLLVVLLAV